MNEQRTKALIESRGREIILKVHKYFEDEKERCKALLQRLNVLQQENTEVRVPLGLYSEVLKYFKSTFQVSKRVVTATCINKNTLTRIRVQGPIPKSKNPDGKRKPRGKVKYFNQEEFKELEKIIQATLNNKKDFKFKTLFSLVRRDLKYTGSLATLRRIVWDMGYRWEKKPGSAYVTFLEKVPCTSTEMNYTSNEHENMGRSTEENIKMFKKYDHQENVDIIDMPEECDDWEMNANKNFEQTKKIEIYVEPRKSQTAPHYLHINPIITKSENADAWGCNHKIFIVEGNENKKISESPEEMIHMMEETDGWENHNKNAVSGQLQSGENTSSSCANMQCLKPEPTTEIFLKEEFILDTAEE